MNPIPQGLSFSIVSQNWCVSLHKIHTTFHPLCFRTCKESKGSPTPKLYSSFLFFTGIPRRTPMIDLQFDLCYLSQGVHASPLKASCMFLKIRNIILMQMRALCYERANTHNFRIHIPLSTSFHRCLKKNYLVGDMQFSSTESQHYVIPANADGSLPGVETSISTT